MLLAQASHGLSVQSSIGEAHSADNAQEPLKTAKRTAFTAAGVKY
jgi:hypothetical protein